MSLKARILCTEDDKDTCEMLSFLLRNEGYEIISVASSDDALELARTGTFDLYLLDNWMPGLTGVELTKEIRVFDMKTPILFYSGVAHGPDIEEARLAGAQEYLVKPVETDVLIATVSRLIASSQKAFAVKGH